MTEKIPRKMKIVSLPEQLKKTDGVILIIPKEIIEGLVGSVLVVGEKDIKDGSLRKHNRFEYCVSANTIDLAVLSNVVTKDKSQIVSNFLRETFDYDDLIVLPSSCLEPVLLPCPHCGGEAYKSGVECGGVDELESGCIKCSKCGACGPTKSSSWWDIIDGWNRRHDPKPLREVVIK